MSSITSKWLEDSSERITMRRGQRRRGAALACCCAAIFILSGCNRQAGPARERHNEATPVTVAQVTNVAWDRAVSIIGTLYGKDEATLGAQVEGSVEQTLVDFGDRVRTNEDLAFIDTG